MAQQYDVSLKLLFRYSHGIIARALFGEGGVTEWLSVEQPRVNNPRPDLLARCGDGSLRNVELQSYNDPELPRRKAEYYLGFWRLIGEHVDQIVLFVSPQKLTMPPTLKTKSMTYKFRILDVKTLDGEPLLASEDWGDNFLALLTPVEQERILQRVEQQLRRLAGQEQQDAANMFAIISGIIGIEEIVLKRVSMIDIMENKILGPAIRQGIEQGKIEGERGVLLRQLTRKFGSLPDSVATRVQKASESELSKWIDGILTARTLDEVLN